MKPIPELRVIASAATQLAAIGRQQPHPCDCKGACDLTCMLRKAGQ